MRALSILGMSSGKIQHLLGPETTGESYMDTGARYKCIGQQGA
ncbi:unnamed protein product [Gulo gulo]|uniref:Uncharacterized protein n=1 Tax=Gulo gulo TaxID=48420 RepID=A0A9X9PWP7_GULGU|nr:unnamed protein product [Gulo gulo]